MLAQYRFYWNALTDYNIQNRSQHPFVVYLKKCSGKISKKFSAICLQILEIFYLNSTGNPFENSSEAFYEFHRQSRNPKLVCEFIKQSWQNLRRIRHFFKKIERNCIGLFFRKVSGIFANSFHYFFSVGNASALVLRNSSGIFLKFGILHTTLLLQQFVWELIMQFLLFIFYSFISLSVCALRISYTMCSRFPLTNPLKFSLTTLLKTCSVIC